MENNWFIEQEDNIEIEEIKDVSSVEKTDSSPVFTKDKINLIYKYTIINQYIVNTEIKVKRENES